MSPVASSSNTLTDANCYRWEMGCCVAIGLLCGLFFLWSTQQPAATWTLLTKDPRGYYPLQTAGFQSGHTYVALVPHPALLALPDPYDPVANAPYRVHDMSLFQGHYYMYYGPTPVVLFFWPMLALTGRFPTEMFAVALFCSVAVGAGLALLFALRRRHFPRASSWVFVSGAACLAFANPINLLALAPQFYQVPISCAIALQVLMLGAIYCAAYSRRPLPWLAVAGLLFGLSVGARPNYLPGFLVLAYAVYKLGQARTDTPGKRFGWTRRAATFAFAPAAACGLALLAYNSARFGSVSELGTHFQLAGTRVADLQQFGLGNFVRNLGEYFFKPGTWQSYFPFFAADSVTAYGLLRYVPWYWVALATVVPWRGNSLRDLSGERLVVLSVGGAALGNLLLLACFAVTNSRYIGDFANTWLLAAGIGALVLSQRSSGTDRSAWVTLGLTILAVFSIFVSGAVYLDRFPNKNELISVERIGNWPSYEWQRLHGGNFGGLQLDLRLPSVQPLLPEPLLETGRQVDQRDWLQVEYLSPTIARLGFFHAGTGEFASREFPIPADRHVVVLIECGSLLPPFGYPIFRRWSHDDYDLARRSLRVKVNGTEVLHLALDCYESSPANNRVGMLGWFTGGMGQMFTGEVLGVVREPLVKPARLAPLFQEHRPIELSLLLPSGKTGGSDPILVTGHGTESDLVYCVYDSLNHIKFALDHFGAGGPVSESVPFDPLVPHKVLIWMGSIAAPAGGEGGATPGRLTIVFDGKPLLNVEQVFYPSTPETIVVGYNPFASTVTSRAFSGRVDGLRQVSPDDLPALQLNGSYGAVGLSLRFPLGVLGTNEPLVVTGESGAGDFVYIKYQDLRHVVIGFDHWGRGGLVGDPVEVDYGVAHHLSISIGSLYAPGTAGPWAKVVRVLLDGQIALKGEWECHPSSSSQIRIGKNPIGGSTCGPAFTGTILAVDRYADPDDGG